MVFPIQLPDDAPFTPAQRAWLNEFLAQALAQGGTVGTPATASVPVTVIYGSQTGTAEGLAKKLVKTLKKGNFEPVLHEMGTYENTRLPAEKNLLIITSTYGDGEPPDSAAAFHSWLMSADAPKLEGVSYSVLALGDSSYPDFCKCGIEFDTRLAELGAARIHDRVDVDVDPDEPYRVWSAGVLARLAPSVAVGISPTAADSDAEDVGFSKSRPFPASIVENCNLNGPGDKQTHQIAFSLDGSGLAYGAGVMLNFIPFTKLRLDYTRYEADDGEFDSLGLSGLFTF